MALGFTMTDRRTVMPDEPVWLPDEPGSEEAEWESLCDRAAVNAGTRICLCSHLEIEHFGGGCTRKLCGCFVFRPRNTASRTAKIPAAGKAVA
jgi:hypothetical protein